MSADVHVHRNLRPIREDGEHEGDLVAKVCPGCFSLFHPISGKPVKRGTRMWQRAHEVMRRHLESVAGDKSATRRQRRRARSVL
jgi:hypothetical protein